MHTVRRSFPAVQVACKLWCYAASCVCGCKLLTTIVFEDKICKIDYSKPMFVPSTPCPQSYSASCYKVCRNHSNRKNGVQKIWQFCPKLPLAVGVWQPSACALFQVKLQAERHHVKGLHKSWSPRRERSLYIYAKDASWTLSSRLALAIASH